MGAAQGTNWIYDAVHLLQIHSVHLAVKLLKGCLNLDILHLIALTISLVQHSQHRIPVAKIRTVPGDTLFKCITYLFHADLRHVLFFAVL